MRQLLATSELNKNYETRFWRRTPQGISAKVQRRKRKPPFNLGRNRLDNSSGHFVGDAHLGRMVYWRNFMNNEEKEMLEEIIKRLSDIEIAVDDLQRSIDDINNNLPHTI